jgi:DNA modification methylase
VGISVEMTYAKSSGAKSKRANELDGKTWTRYSISIWSDIRKTEEEMHVGHPAMFPVQLVTRLLECFTISSDKVVLDPFAGVGSTLIAAEKLGKQGIGFEVSREFVDIARHRLSQRPLWSAEGASIVYHSDANTILEHIRQESVDIVVTSPPYWDILTRRRTADNKETRHYGDAKTDLGKVSDYRDFLTALSGVFQQVFQVLRSGKYCIVVVMDIRKQSRFYPFHADFAAMMQDIRFVYDDLIIWDRRHEYNNMRPLGYPYVFRVNKAHEFILIFQKPTSRLSKTL